MVALVVALRLVAVILLLLASLGVGHPRVSLLALGLAAFVGSFLVA